MKKRGRVRVAYVTVAKTAFEFQQISFWTDQTSGTDEAEGFGSLGCVQALLAFELCYRQLQRLFRTTLESIQYTSEDLMKQGSCFYVLRHWL